MEGEHAGVTTISQNVQGEGLPRTRKATSALAHFLRAACCRLRFPPGRLPLPSVSVMTREMSAQASPCMRRCFVAELWYAPSAMALHWLVSRSVMGWQAWLTYSYPNSHSTSTCACSAHEHSLTSG